MSHFTTFVRLKKVVTHFLNFHSSASVFFLKWRLFGSKIVSRSRAQLQLTSSVSVDVRRRTEPNCHHYVPPGWSNVKQKVFLKHKKYKYTPAYIGKSKQLPPRCTTWLEQCEAKSISEIQRIQIHTSIYKNQNNWHLHEPPGWSNSYQKIRKYKNTKTQKTHCHHDVPPGWRNVKQKVFLKHKKYKYTPAYTGKSKQLPPPRTTRMEQLLKSKIKNTIIHKIHDIQNVSKTKNTVNRTATTMYYLAGAKTI